MHQQTDLQEGRATGGRKPWGHVLESGERSRQDFKGFYGLGVGRCRKPFGESQGASTWEACVQVTNLPAQLHIPGETAQLSM